MSSCKRSQTIESGGLRELKNNKYFIYFIYTAKNRSDEYKKTAGTNLCAVIKYFKIKKTTIVHCT